MAKRKPSACATFGEPMLSTTQIDQYHQDGYVVPDYRLPNETIHAIKIDHARLIERYPQFFDYCGALLLHDFRFLNYARNPDILDMVEQLIGPDIALWNSSLFAKPARTGTYDGPGELQEAAFHVVVGKAGAEESGQPVEFLDGVGVAAAVAADHHGDCHGAWSLPSCVTVQRAGGAWSLPPDP